MREAMRHLIACVLMTCSSLASATNGLNLIGYGAESSLMGGADVAVARDAAALNTNPAGLMQLRGPSLDIYGASSYALDVGHSDLIGNNLQVDNKLINVAGFGYARPLEDRRWVIGFGAFAQGGAGAVFKSMQTPFGTTDELSSQFGAVRLTGGGAYRVDEALSVGAAVSLLIGASKQQQFPHTSVITPAGPFFGSSLKDATGHGFGFKLGAQYRLSPTLNLGASYTAKTRLPLKHGNLVVNMTAAGLGPVAYQDASIDGLAFPQTAALGFAWQSAPKLLWSFKYEWLDWSSAIRASTLTATGPSNPAAPATLTNSQILAWRDQHVIAAGMAYDYDQRTTLRAGFNYGRSPVPNERNNPIINPIGEKHLAFGMSRKMEGGYELHGGVEYQLPNTVYYNNPSLPFGPSSWREESIALHFMFSRRW